MKENFNDFLKVIISECSLLDYWNEIPKEAEIFSKEIDKEFKVILDRMATELIYITFENERLVKALLKLARIERIIIVFHIVLGMQQPELALLLNISTDNVYARKYRGLNMLRKYMNQE